MTAQGLVVTHCVHEKVTVVGSRVQGAGDIVPNVDDRVRYVGEKVDKVLDSAQIVFSYSLIPFLHLPGLDGEERRVALQRIPSDVYNKNRS